MAKQERYKHAFVELSSIFRIMLEGKDQKRNRGFQANNRFAPPEKLLHRTCEIRNQVGSWVKDDFLPPLDHEDIISLASAWEELIVATMEYCVMKDMRLVQHAEIKELMNDILTQANIMEVVNEHVMKTTKQPVFHTVVKEWRELQVRINSCYMKELAAFVQGYPDLQWAKNYAVLHQLGEICKCCSRIYDVIERIVIKG